MKTKPTHQTAQTEWEERLQEDFKRKDWTSEDWKNSPEDIDRLIWLISSFSPHNLWKAREAIRDLLQSHTTQVVETLNEMKKNKEDHDAFDEENAVCYACDYDEAIEDTITLLTAGEQK